MKTTIAAPSGFQMLRVWGEDFDHDVVPVIAFIVDPDATEKVNAISVTGQTLDQCMTLGDAFSTALLMPGGRVVCAGGFEYENTRAFVRSCREIADIDKLAKAQDARKSKPRLRVVKKARELCRM